MFVHGTLGDLHTFRTQAQTFATRFRVISYSRRYHPAQRSTSGSRCQSSERSCGRPTSAGKGTESHSSASRGALLWRVHRARAGGGPSRARAQPRSRRAARPAAALPHVSGRSRGQSWIRRVIEPSRKAFESGSLEDGLRQFMDGICGNRLFRQPPTIPTNGVGGKTSARIASGVDDRDRPPSCLPSTVGIWGS